MPDDIILERADEPQKMSVVFPDFLNHSAVKFNSNYGTYNMGFGWQNNSISVNDSFVAINGNFDPADKFSWFEWSYDSIHLTSTLTTTTDTNDYIYNDGQYTYLFIKEGDKVLCGARLDTGYLDVNSLQAIQNSFDNAKLYTRSDITDITKTIDDYISNGGTIKASTPEAACEVPNPDEFVLPDDVRVLSTNFKMYAKGGLTDDEKRLLESFAENMDNVHINFLEDTDLNQVRAEITYGTDQESVKVVGKTK